MPGDSGHYASAQASRVVIHPWIPKMGADNTFVRRLLEDWARWLCNGGGYAHQSSIEYFRAGGIGSGVFESSVPKDVEPSASVARTSIAMQHLRLLDGESAVLLATLYLRKRETRLLDLARQAGMGLSAYQDRRRAAEAKILSLWQSLGDKNFR